MFRKILNLFVAASVATSAVAAPAGAQTYMFRYKAPVSASDPVVPPETEYGLGNDIVAYYVAPIGYVFSKKIPVATQDVVDWRMDSGEIPGGIGIDPSNGLLSGQPVAEETDKALFHGYDRSGNRIARAEIHFTTFEPVGEPVLVDFYAHVGTYFYGAIPNPQNTTVARWEPIVPYAAGMSMMGQALQGTPEAAGNWGVAWRGYDYLDREVAFAYGDLVVEEGPVVEEMVGNDFRRSFGDQTANKNTGDTFGIRAAVRRALGPVTYRLVPVAARPSGIDFSSAAGTLTGVFDDFETSAQFRIEARDSYDGTTGLSNVFTLETLPQEISLANVHNLYGYAGKTFFRKFTTPNLVPTARWKVVSGTLPAGLSLDPVSGAISGTLSRKETQIGIVIGVSGEGMIAAQSSPFTFTVYPEYLTRETTALHVRTNTPFKTEGVRTSSALTAYSVSASSPLHGDLSVDPQSGAVSSGTGLSQAGNHDVRLMLDNGNQFHVWQVIRAYYPLEVSYESREIKRNLWTSIYPTVNDNSRIGTETYTIRDLDGDPLPSWMGFQAWNGRIYGTPSDKSTIDVTYGPFVVTRTDAQNSVDSAPFSIKVLDRDPVELTISNNGVERFVTNGYRIADAAKSVGWVHYTVVSAPANWPSSLRINSNGVITGRTEDPVGTVYKGLVVRAEDSEGYADVSDPFDLVVKEPGALSGLSGSLTPSIEWTAGMPYTGVLPRLSNGYGNIIYSFTDAPGAVSLTDPSRGAYGFSFPEESSHVAAFTIDDETERAPAQGSLTIKINPGLSISAPASIPLNRAAAVSEAFASVSGGTQPISYSQTGALPKGVSFSNGLFYGTPEVEGAFPVSVSVTDKAGMTRTATFTLDVGAPLPIEVAYPADALTVGQFKVVWPDVQNAVGSLTYDLTAPVDVNGNKVLPEGVGFDSNGRFIGTPLEAGVFGPYSVKVTDSDSPRRSGSLDSFSLVVTRTGEVEFPDVTKNVRLGASFSMTLAAGNIVPPVGYTVSSPEPLPEGLLLNGATGGLSGTLTEEGAVSFSVTAKDRMLREKTAVVTLVAVGDMVASATDAGLKQYEASAHATTISTANTLGAVSFGLSSGILPSGLAIDPTTGAVTGTSDESGTWPISVDVTDTDGQKKTVSFSVNVSPRDPLVVETPPALSLKRFSTTSFAPTIAGAIPPVQYAVTPDLPAGMTLDSATGEISGSSDAVVGSTVYTLTAIDAKAGVLGTDTASFTLEVAERDPLQVSVPNIESKRYSDPTSVAAVPVSAVGAVTYSVSPDLPAGFVLDPATGVISGKSDAVVQSQHTLTASDEKGGQLGTATSDFTISVSDRDALEFVTAADQPVLLAEPYALALAVKNVVGQNVKWTQVSGALPVGLSFDPATGTISGTASNYDERTSFTVKAEDDFGGEATLVIAFAVVIAPGDLVISAQGGTTRVNEPFSIVTPTVSDTIGTVTWSLSAPGTGLTIDPSTGEITGTPTSLVDADAAITVKDVTGRRGSTTVRVKAVPRIELSVAATMAVTFNYDVDPALQASASQVVGTTVWTLSGPSLPAGLSLDPATGAIRGKPQAIGTFGPYSLTVADDLPGSTTTTFSIEAVMNGDPIELSVTDFETKIGYPVQTELPAYGNNLGPVTFFSADLGGTGLSIDASNGVLTGTAQALADRFLNVSVRDRDTVRVTSRPLRYKVIPTMQVVLPSQVIISALSDITPVSPTRNNVIGTATWEPLDESVNKLPEGIIWDPATGTLRGNATEIGTFGPFTVASTDSIGDRGVSNSFVVKSNPGAFFLGLAASALPDATKRTESYAFDFSPLLTTVGMDLSEVTWSASGLPPGLSIDKGRLSGTPSLSGVFNFSVSASYGSITATRSYTLKVGLPQAGLELAAADLGEAKRAITGQDKSFSADLKPRTTVQNIPLAAVSFSLEPFQPISQTENESFPAGLTLNADGTITGTASSSAGTYQFRVKATFTDATDESYSSIATQKITVRDEIGFDFGSAGFAGSYKRLAYSFDLATLLDASKTKGVAASQLTWSLSLDAANAVAPNMTTMPSGLSVSGSTLSGTPITSGDFAVVVTAAFDGRSKSKAFILRSDLQAIDLKLAGSLANGEFLKAYNADLKSFATVKNIPADKIVWSANGNVTLGSGESAGLPPGLALSQNGILSGTASKAGKYRFEVVADWTDTNPAAETLQAKLVLMVDIKGVAPTVSVSPNASGYPVVSSASIPVSIGNGKTGDVVSLAPGSAPLPPGMSITTNGTSYYLSKPSAVASSYVSVYKGIKLRVTDVDGLYGESAPFAVVYASQPRLQYPNITFTSRANEPVSVARGTPTGAASADVTFAIISRGAGGANLTIDPATGRLGGFITADGGVTVQYTESYDGIFIRSGTYNANYTVDVVSASLANMAAIEGQPYSSRIPKIENARAPATFSISGDTGGFDLNPSTGRLSSAAPAAGTYAMTLTYSDAFGSATRPFSIRVMDGSTGHRFWKVEGQKNSNYRGDVFELRLNVGGHVANEAAALSSSQAAALDDNEDTSVNVGQSAKTVIGIFDFKKKMPVDTLVATVATGFKTSLTLTVSWSDDGTTWTTAGTITGGVGSGTVVTLQKALTN